MLALIHDDEVIDTYPEGGWFDVPGVGRTSPAEHGWMDGGYRLATVLPADPIPEGHFVVSTSVEMVGGEPKHVHVTQPNHQPLSEISTKQFFMGLEVVGKITKEEALDAVLRCVMPPPVQAIIDGMADEDAKYQATMHLIGSNNLDRYHPLVMPFAVTQGMSEEDVDDFWRLCSSI